jgi:hypothetical protein
MIDLSKYRSEVINEAKFRLRKKFPEVTYHRQNYANEYIEEIYRKVGIEEKASFEDLPQFGIEYELEDSIDLRPGHEGEPYQVIYIMDEDDIKELKNAKLGIKRDPKKFI